MADYDPKQVALLDRTALADAVAEAEKTFAAAPDLDALFAARPAHLGDRAPVALARREIGALPPAAKSDAGKRVNMARTAIQAAYDARHAVLVAERETRVLREEAVDVTVPVARRPRGARHPLTTLADHIGDLFAGMGYEVVESPEDEVEPSASGALDVAPRDPSRALLTRKPPVRVVSTGRVLRTGEPDATRSPVFHQVDGLVVDRGITMGHLKGTLDHLARAVFGPQARTRLRPSYFPFTEPGAEVDLWFPGAVGGPRWVGWAGCGMVGPRVLRACGVDPDEYGGFAFGVGIERTLMFRNGVTDLRDLVDGDVRFSRAFGTGSAEG
jgi:phenylalanyl-tRNA synthetase alpha chain